MNAREYLEKRCPDTVKLIGTYVTTPIDLERMLDGYHQQRSQEEAEERYEKARVWYNTRLSRTGLDDTDDEAIITNKALRIASGKE
jgi:hypothetical protein